MQKHQFSYRPSLTEQEGNTLRINFDIEETEQTVDNMHGSEEASAEPETQTVWLAHVVRVPASASYADIVSAIVRSHYSENDVEAILLNGTGTPDHKAEYNELQSWRTHAKEVAKAVLAE